MLRGADPGGAWEVVGRRPAPALRSLVRGYFGYDERARGRVRRLEVAQPWVTLLIELGSARRVTASADHGEGASRRAFVAGLRDGPLHVRHEGRSRGLEVMLPPLGAYRLLGMPLSEFGGGVVALEDVFGAAGSRLCERVAQASSWAACFDHLDGFFLDSLDGSPAWSAEIAGAWRRLEATGGQAAIGQIARDTGWSRRRLALRFREQVGMTPKTTAQLLRFRAATALLARPGHRSLAAVALSCGFYDQAHLNRDFVRFGGCTPAEFRSLRSADALASAFEPLTETIFQDGGPPPL